MYNVSDTRTKQTIATGSSEEDALGVLMPRILGAIETHGIVPFLQVRDEWRVPATVMDATEGDFEIYLETVPAEPEGRSDLGFVVFWKDKEVMVGHLNAKCRGTSLNGVVHVESWQRGGELAAWQSAIFEVFPIDSRILESECIAEALYSLNRYRVSIMPKAAFDGLAEPVAGQVVIPIEVMRGAMKD
jgi:hypothetical protein